jgi:hypothetical protein
MKQPPQKNDAQPRGIAEGASHNVSLESESDNELQQLDIIKWLRQAHYHAISQNRQLLHNCEFRIIARFGFKNANRNCSSEYRR